VVSFYDQINLYNFFGSLENEYFVLRPTRILFKKLLFTIQINFMFDYNLQQIMMLCLFEFQKQFKHP